MGILNFNNKKEYGIYFSFGELKIEDLSEEYTKQYENLTKEEAKRKLEEIKKKIEDGVVEIVDENILNWKVICSCYISEM